MEVGRRWVVEGQVTVLANAQAAEIGRVRTQQQLAASAGSLYIVGTARNGVESPFPLIPRPPDDLSTEGLRNVLRQLFLSKDRPEARKALETTHQGHAGPVVADEGASVTHKVVGDVGA